MANYCINCNWTKDQQGLWEAARTRGSSGMHQILGVTSPGHSHSICVVPHYYCRLVIWLVINRKSADNKLKYRAADGPQQKMCWLIWLRVQFRRRWHRTIDPHHGRQETTNMIYSLCFNELGWFIRFCSISRHPHPVPPLCTHISTEPGCRLIQCLIVE